MSDFLYRCASLAPEDTVDDCRSRLPGHARSSINGAQYILTRMNASRYARPPVCRPDTRASLDTCACEHDEVPPAIMIAAASIRARRSSEIPGHDKQEVVTPRLAQILEHSGHTVIQMPVKRTHGGENIIMEIPAADSRDPPLRDERSRTARPAPTPLSPGTVTLPAGRVQTAAVPGAALRKTD